MLIDLTGKTALVTGAGSGIGAAIARSLAESGARVWVNDIDSSSAERVANQVQAKAVPGDVAHPREWMHDWKEPLHILVHNAGYDMYTPIAELERAEVERLYSVMVAGPLEMTQMLLQPLIAAKGACVIFIASVHARVTTPEMSAYTAAKGAQVAMVNSLAQDLGRHKIRVLAVSPGYIETPLMDKWINGTPDPPATRKRAHDLHSMGRMGKPQDVAALVTFLASPTAEFINATNITIDGGISTRLPE